MRLSPLFFFLAMRRARAPSSPPQKKGRRAATHGRSPHTTLPLPFQKKGEIFPKKIKEGEMGAHFSAERAAFGDLPDDILLQVLDALCAADVDAYLEAMYPAAAPCATALMRASKALCAALRPHVRVFRAEVACRLHLRLRATMGWVRTLQVIPGAAYTANDRDEWRTDREAKANEVPFGKQHLVLDQRQCERTTLVARCLKASEKLECLTVYDVLHSHELMSLLAAARVSASLRCLTLSFIVLVAEEAAVVAELVCTSRTLTTVFLAECSLDDDAVARFGSLGGSTVELIDLSRNDALSGIGVFAEGLMGRPPERPLELHLNKAGGPHMMHDLAGALRVGAIQCLDVSEWTIGEASAGALADALSAPRCQLKELNLDGTGLRCGDASVLAEGVAASASLRTLSLAHNDLRGGVAHVARAVCGGAALTSLDISYCQLMFVDARDLCEALQASASQLTNLYVNHVRLSKGGAAKIAEGVGRSRSLRLLSAYGGWFWDGHVTPAFAAAAASSASLAFLIADLVHDEGLQRACESNSIVLM
jgi:hypothetical protein